MGRHSGFLCCALFLLTQIGPIPVRAEAPEINKASVKNTIDRALWYLRNEQLEDGSWAHYPGITALCLTAFAKSPRQYREVDGPFIRKPAQFLLQFQDEKGAFVPPDGALPVYNTGVSMMALASLENASYEEPLRKAQEYLIRVQCDDGEDYESSDRFFGGIGYGNDLRPDLSNLQIALEALRDTDLPSHHAVWTRAICFLERCQNLSAYNDQPGAGNDGGFVYYPGYSQAGEEEEGTLRSYGSMTYAGLKSYIYCGLSPKDPRVQAALEWTRKHYSLEENPGLGPSGLFYYYMVFARTFNVLEIDILQDAEGIERRPFADLAKVLVSRQKPDGSWVNEGSGRWWEDNPALCTAYAVLALSEACKAMEN